MTQGEMPSDQPEQLEKLERLAMRFLMLEDFCDFNNNMFLWALHRGNPKKVRELAKEFDLNIPENYTVGDAVRDADVIAEQLRSHFGTDQAVIEFLNEVASRFGNEGPGIKRRAEQRSHYRR